MLQVLDHNDFAPLNGLITVALEWISILLSDFIYCSLFSNFCCQM